MLEASHRFYLPWKSASMSGFSYRESASNVLSEKCTKRYPICRLSLTSENEKCNL